MHVGKDRHAQALATAEQLQAFLLAADETITVLRETAPALAPTEDALDATSAAERRRKHEEAVAELAATAPKVQQVRTAGKKLLDTNVRPRPRAETRRAKKSWLRTKAMGVSRSSQPAARSGLWCALQLPEKPTVEAKLSEIDTLWNDLNAQAKVRQCWPRLTVCVCLGTLLGTVADMRSMANGTTCGARRQSKRSKLQEAANMSLFFRLLDDLEKWLKEVEAALATDDVGKDLAGVQVRSLLSLLPGRGVRGHLPNRLVRRAAPHTARPCAGSDQEALGGGERHQGARAAHPKSVRHRR